MDEKQRKERTQEAIVEAVLFTMGQSVELGKLAAALEEKEETARLVAMRLKERDVPMVGRC